MQESKSCALPLGDGPMHNGNSIAYIRGNFKSVDGIYKELSVDKKNRNVTTGPILDGHKMTEGG